MNFTDPGEVVLSGQNPFMILFDPEQNKPINFASLWRIDYSPHGEGQVLFFGGEATGGELRAYADHEPLARYISSEIYRVNSGPFQRFGSPDLRVIAAKFARQGDPRSTVTEIVSGGGDSIELAFGDFMRAFKGGVAADAAAGKAHAHYALYFPARMARLTLNGQPVSGTVIPMKRGDRDWTSGGLALAETWTRAETQ